MRQRGALASGWRSRAVVILSASALAVLMPSPPAWAIIGGQDTSVTASSPLRAVVKVDGTSPSGTAVIDNCSGTLIAPNRVLTARNYSQVLCRPCLGAA